jgi:flagellar hook-basal body complex protein FliE
MSYEVFQALGIIVVIIGLGVWLWGGGDGSCSGSGFGLGLAIVVVGYIMLFWIYSHTISFISVLIIAGVTTALYFGHKEVEKQDNERRIEQAKEAEWQAEQDELRHQAETAKAEAEKQKRRQNSSTFRDKVNSAVQNCSQNYQNAKSSAELTFTYRNSELQNKLWEAVNDASMPLQKLDDIVTELSAEKEENK